MEPPKKRKYPEILDLVSPGASVAVGVAMEAEQQAVVTSQGGGAAKRNRRSYRSRQIKWLTITK